VWFSFTNQRPCRWWLGMTLLGSFSMEILGSVGSIRGSPTGRIVEKPDEIGEGGFGDDQLDF
jgi:hypothetical protein